MLIFQGVSCFSLGSHLSSLNVLKWLLDPNFCPKVFLEGTESNLDLRFTNDAWMEKVVKPKNMDVSKNRGIPKWMVYFM